MQQNYLSLARTTRQLSGDLSSCALFAQTSFFIDCIITPKNALVNTFL
jgi:hypothetical protein